MKKQMHQRIAQALEEEEAHEPDMILLDKLRKLASEDTTYFTSSPEQRNALNAWFAEVREMLFNELMLGNYGVQILLDSFFILCFEVGNKLASLPRQHVEE